MEDNNAIRPLTSHLSRHAEYCWRSKDEFISDVLLWIQTHGHTQYLPISSIHIKERMKERKKTYMHHLFDD